MMLQSGSSGSTATQSVSQAPPTYQFTKAGLLILVIAMFAMANGKAGRIIVGILLLIIVFMFVVNYKEVEKVLFKKVS